MSHHARIWAAVAAAMGTGGLLLPAGVAFAQQAPAAAGDTLEEVVVTAERTETNIQTTPIAITAISGDQLKEMQLTTVTDLQKSVPNVQVLDAGPYQSINIRGIGNTAITPSIVPGVAVTHDGLLSPETIFIGEPFMDIADVEVLRGPQGTLVGASSTGGAVQIKSRDPDFKGINGYAETKFGNYNDQAFNAAINLPISDTLAARVAVNWEQRKSFSRMVDNRFPQAAAAYPLSDPGQVNDRNARLGFLWKPTDKYQAVLKITLNTSNPEGTAGEPNQNTFNSGVNAATGAQLACPDGTAGPICHSLYYNWSTHVPFLLNYNLPYSVQKTTSNRYSLDQGWDLHNGMHVRSLTGVQNLDGGDRYQDDDYSAAPSAVHYKDVGPNNSYFSQEFEVKSVQDKAITWIAGATWFYRDTPVYNVGYSAPTFFANSALAVATAQTQSQGIVPWGPTSGATLAGTRITYSNTHTAQRTEGLYGNVKWQITPKLDMQVGIRGNWDQNFVHVPDGWFPGQPKGAGAVRLDVTTAALLTNNGLLPMPACAPVINGVQYKCAFTQSSTQQTDSVPTGKIGLNWEPFDDQFLYAFYARGYKSGGVRIRSGVEHAAGLSDGFKPETVDDYELGWKSTMLDNHLRTSLGGYYMLYHDMQLPQFNTALGANGVDNIKTSSTIKGLEFTANARVGNWGSDLSLTYGQSALGSTDIVASYRLPPSSAGQAQCITVPTGGCAPGNPVPPGSPGTTGFDYTPYISHLSGKQQPFSPKVSANISLNYRFAMGADGELKPSINYAYTGSQYTTIFQDDNYYKLEARRLVNVSVEYSTGQWDTQLYCNNCSNNVYIAGAGGVAVGDVWYYGAPMQIGLRINRKF